MIKGLDISISVLYILGIVAIGLLAGLKEKTVGTVITVELATNVSIEKILTTSTLWFDEIQLR